MFPTSINFKGRWSSSFLCMYCCNVETDEHLFRCCGYIDIVQNKLNHTSLIKLDVTMEMLSEYAKILLRVHERLMNGREDKELNGTVNLNK